MRYFYFLSFVFISFGAVSQTDVQLRSGMYRALLLREDGSNIVFNFLLKKEKKKPVLYIVNATERIRVNDIRQQNDSLFIQMPFFESSFRIKVRANGHWQGEWVKQGAAATYIMPFSAVPGTSYRFQAVNGNAKTQLTGRWEVLFTRPDGSLRPSVADFKQNGNLLTGTFLNPSGDYRYLQGIVTGNQLLLSCFDGSHAFLFTARISDSATIRDGVFYDGAGKKEPWVAAKNFNAALPQVNQPATIKPGASLLNFSFPNLNGQPVSIRDERFQNKVVVVQIMGSWCPNCMDETKFLSSFYDKNKDNGVEVIALAYEYSTDFDRSVKSIRKFQQQFKVAYPMLVTGVAVSDTNRTEKTIPQVTPIRSFPTTIILDKKGAVRFIENTFYGPGTGPLYEAFVQQFEKRIRNLLAE